MSDPSRRKSRLFLIALTAAAALTWSPHPPVVFDIDAGEGVGHATLRIGFASLHVAFDSGQPCSISDSCTDHSLRDQVWLVSIRGLARGLLNRWA